MKSKKQKAIEYLPDITTKVIFEDKGIKFNTPVQIKYEGRLFKINTNDFFDKIQVTWKCEYYRRLKDKPKTQININFFLKKIIQKYVKIFSKNVKNIKKGDNTDNGSKKKNEAPEGPDTKSSENTDNTKKKNEIDNIINNFENN